MYIYFGNALKNNPNFFQGMKKAKIMYINFENEWMNESEISIEKIIESIKTDVATGIDNIPAKIIKQAKNIAP